MPSIAACINVFNDAAALRGWLETHCSYFDNLFVIHSGPAGVASTDGTMELLEEYGIAPVMADINQGFGVIRSRLIHECGCEWAFIMDADERFFPIQQTLRCEGDQAYPEFEFPGLTVRRHHDVICPGTQVKEQISRSDIDSIRTIRRHWQSFTMTAPCQNWETRPDWQLRIVRNIAEIGYKSDVRMHEQLIDRRTGGTPRFFSASHPGGPFHDHFHLWFRRKFPGKKEANERYYDRLSRGEV